MGRKATGPIIGSAGLPTRRDRVIKSRAFQRCGNARFLKHEDELRRVPMIKERDEVLTTNEACRYLRISRPTFLKLVHSNQIKARKVGKGWKVLRSELRTYLKVQDPDDFEMAMIS